MPLNVPVTQTGLEASIQAAAKSAGRNLKINLGTSAKSIEGLSQPLGRITGKADQFTKSMEAANARVLAFGASVGVLNAVTQGFKDLISTTVQVEKQLASINSILGASAGQLNDFKKTIFAVAKDTEQSFDTVATAALELSRQGLKTEQVIERLNDSMVLTRLSGLAAGDAVSGLTAAINSFNKSGISSAEVLNKLSAAAISAAVSERDLIEGIKRSGAVAIQAGVSFDELVGVITAVQEKTARGGAVIGNSFKTIFTRIQSLDKLQTIQNLGAQVTDASGDVLSGTKLIQNLAKALEDLPEARKLQIAESLVGKFQIAPFLAILDDYTSKTSTAIRVTEVASRATTEAYTRNVALNETLAAAINAATVNLKELANTLGEIGVTESLSNILQFFNSLVGNIKDLLEGEGIGSDFARGIVKGISNVISGPGLAIFGAIIAKLTIDLVRFGTTSLTTFFGINKSAKDLALIQGQLASTLLGNKGIQETILRIENSTLTTEQKRLAQTKFFTTALNEQLLVMQRMQTISAKIAPGVLRGTSGSRTGRGAEGYIPNFNAVMGYGSEAADIKRGVGGAPSSAKPVVIPNFNFGGGQRGTMVANSSEFVVPNFLGGDGSAIFNQDMVQSGGLPAGARRVQASRGFVPNYVRSVADFTKALTGQSRSVIEKAAIKSRDPNRQLAAQQILAGGKKGILNIEASRYGVAALLAGKKTDVSQTALSQVASPLSTKLQNRGVTGIRFSGIQIRSLKDMEGGVKRGPMSPRRNRNVLAKNFTEPLLRYGSEIIGSVFSNDEASDIKTEIGKVSRGEGANLFSSAVEGGIFESAVRLVTKGARGIEEFKSHISEQAPFDFEEGGPATKPFRDAFGFSSILAKADAKRTASNDAVRTVIGKALREPGESGFILRQATSQGFVDKKRTRKAASGYVPNFVGTALGDAVERERSAGVPINQIRINQSGRLRNAQNPRGLAVTNMRDEPTGAIPNFKKGDLGAASTDLLTKFFILQTSMTFLSGVTDETAGKTNLVAESMALLNKVLLVAIGVQAFGGLGKVAGGALIGLKGLGRFFTGSLGKGMMQSANIALKGRMGALGSTTSRGAILPTATKGLAKFTNVLKLAGGSVLRVAGPIGAIATAAWAGGKAINFLTGVSGKQSEVSEKVATAANKAAENLEKLQLLTPEQKKEVEVEASVQAKRIRGSLERRLGTSGITGQIEGFSNDSANFDTLEGAFRNALLKGFDSTQVRTMMMQGTQQFEQLSLDDLNALVNKLDNLKPLDERSQGFRKSITEKELQQIATESRLEAGSTIQGPDGIIRFPDRRTETLDKVKERGAKQFGLSSTIIGGMIDNLAPEIATSQSEVDKKEARQGQLRADLVKAEIISQLKAKEIRLDMLSDDEKRLALGQALNNLTQQEVLSLQEGIALKNEDKEVAKTLNGFIQKQVEGVSQLTLAEAQRDVLKKEIAKISFEDLQTQKGLEVILGNIAKLDKKTREEGEIIVDIIRERLKGAKLESKAKKEVIKDGFKQKQAELDALTPLRERIKILKNAAADRSLERLTNIGVERAGLEAQKGVIQASTAPEEVKVRRINKIMDQIDKLDIEEQKIRAIEETRLGLINLMDQFPGMVEKIQPILKVFKDFNETGDVSKVDLGTVGRLLRNVGSPQGSGSLPEGFAFGVGDVGRTAAEGDEAGRVLRAEKTGAKKQRTEEEKNASGFKNLTQLMQEFGVALRQTAEQLKLDFLQTRSGSDMIANINDQIFKAEKRGNLTKTGLSDATRSSVFRERDDAKQLAQTRAERRDIERQDNILEKQFNIQRKIAEITKDEVVDVDELKRLKQELLDLEKERLAVNETLVAMLENEFVKDQAEIQKNLNKELVSAARQFSDTISDGIVDAIAKGEDLGDTLRNAAADFFRDMAKANMRAAFGEIQSGIGALFRNSGGPIRGGSGTRDDVPAMLTGGEFVMRRSAVDKYGEAFMSSLNAGQIPTMNKGGMFTPGTYGQQNITGKRDLLSFATQSFTTGAFDITQGGANYGAVALEPQSARLTMKGRYASPSFQREQRSKEAAFGLYVDQYEQDVAVKEAAEESKRNFLNSLKAAVITTAIGFGAKKFGKWAQTRAAEKFEASPEFVGPPRAAANRTFTNATGGEIPDVAGIDTVQAMVSGREFMINAGAADRYGRGNLAAINGGAGGGSGDERIVGKLDELITAREKDSTINITINSDGTENTEERDETENQRSLATKIKDVVKQVIDDEKRLGGSLRQVRT